jgi:serine/threonine protein kinase
MGATVAVHPTDLTLQSYGLGKLDDASAESVNKHLEACADCQRRVAEMSSDSFLGRLRDAQGQPGSSGPIVSSLAGLSMLDGGSSPLAPPATSTLPPGLAEHTDYEVVRELGHGGMGTVYLAFNRLMGRHEVLKVVSSHLMSRRGVLDRFQGEIRNAARLHHTNIVTAYSAVRIGESIVFAMEYVEGLDLAKLVKAKGALPVSNACNYVHQAALGLQYAHELGMVHRDIKPSNLMLARQGNRAVIKVLDFGLAKVRSEGAVNSGLTHEGQMLGTPDYIAPEQIRDARDADIRADIYSLGCTLYYLLTGGPPFKATSLYEILQAHHSMDAMPLNLARPEVPVELAALVARMMSKEPERRFQEPKDVAQALLPFFKKGAAASKAEMSRSLSTTDGGAASGARWEPTQVANAASPVPGPSLLAPPVAPVRPEPVWESLIQFKENQPVDVPVSAVVASARPPRWLWPSVAVGSLLLGFLVAWAVIVRVNTKDGQIVVKNIPEHAEASVDDEQLKLKLPGNPDLVEIKPAPDRSGVQVKNGETVVTGEEVNIESAGETPLSVQLEPNNATGQKDRHRGRWRPLFNGKDTTGWTLYRNNRGAWKVDDAVLVGSGGGIRGQPALLVTNRQDFSNFRLRIKSRYWKGQGGRIVIRHLDTNDKRNGYSITIGGGNEIGGIPTPPGSVERLSESPLNAVWTSNQLAEQVRLGAAETYTLEITARENRITSSVNDHKVAEYTDESDGFASGEILLWSTGWSTVEYKEIMIEELQGSGVGGLSTGAVRDFADRPLSEPNVPNVGQPVNGEIRPFNGTNFEGWHAIRWDKVRDPSTVFRIEGEEIVGADGGAGRIFLDRSFSDFSFKFEYFLPIEGRCRGASCRLQLAEGEPFKIGQANFRAGEVACFLTKIEGAEIGDMFSYEYVSANPVNSSEGLTPKTSDAARPLGEWNDVEIRCEGRVIQFLLNGRQVNQVEANRAILLHPGFQSWETDIHIRNIRIATLAKARVGTTQKNRGPSKSRKK